MNSKGYIRFKSRLKNFREDVEIVALLGLRQEEFISKEMFQKLDEALFPSLCARKITAANRSTLLVHLRNTINVAFIKEMYEEVTEYFRYALLQAFMKGVPPEQLIGKHDITMSATELMSLPHYSDVLQAVVHKIFSKMEGERSTLNLIQRMNLKLGLEIDKKLIADALPYLQCRHIFVHADGKPDKEFMDKYPHINIGLRGRIWTDMDFVNAATDAVFRLITAYDAAMIKKDYLPEDEMQQVSKIKSSAQSAG